MVYLSTFDSLHKTVKEPVENAHRSVVHISRETDSLRIVRVPLPVGKTDAERSETELRAEGVDVLVVAHLVIVGEREGAGVGEVVGEREDRHPCQLFSQCRDAF